jgi:broad specificity phosphatase PhoE
VLLIRHGHTDAVGQRLVSRLPGVALSDAGRSEVERLREVLHSEHIRAIYSSPLERAIETAKPIAADHGLPMLQCDGLIEVEFGEWTGKTFDELKHRTDWRRFNEQRGSAAVPGGETAATVQARIVTCLDRLRVTHAGRTIAAVSHADVIRAALLRYTGTPLDDWQRIDIEPASVSAVSLCADGAKVLYVNRRPPLV